MDVISQTNPPRNVQHPRASPPEQANQEPASVIAGTPVVLGVIVGYALATVLEFVGNGAALLGSLFT